MHPLQNKIANNADICLCMPSTTTGLDGRRVPVDTVLTPGRTAKSGLNTVAPKDFFIFFRFPQVFGR